MDAGHFPSCLIGLFQVFGVLEDISLEIKAAIEEGFPELRIKGIQEIPDGEQNPVKQLFPLCCSHGYEERFFARIMLPERRFFYPVFFYPQGLAAIHQDLGVSTDRVEKYRGC